MKFARLVSLLAGLALLGAACGGGDDAADLPIDDRDGTAPPSAGACPAGDPDCQDTLEPLPGEEPIPLDDNGQPIAGGLSVAEVVSTQIDGAFAIQAYYFDTPDGIVLCDGIAESFPPQCAGDQITLDNTAGVEIGPLESERGVTWSNEQVVVVGMVVNGVFVATPMSN